MSHHHHQIITTTTHHIISLHHIIITWMQARALPSYDGLLNDRNQLITVMEQIARDTEPDWLAAEEPTAQPRDALPSPASPTTERRVIRHSSPPTVPTIVQMVSAREETSDGYNVNSPAYFVSSLSPSTTPESGQRRPATWSLRDISTHRRVPAESDMEDNSINPDPTHDPKRG